MSTGLELQDAGAAPQVAAGLRDQRKWSAGLRVAFRFVFAYFVLYVLPFPIGCFPYTDYPAQKYNDLWHKIVR